MSDSNLVWLIIDEMLLILYPIEGTPDLVPEKCYLNEPSSRLTKQMCAIQRESFRFLHFFTQTARQPKS